MFYEEKIHTLAVEIEKEKLADNPRHLANLAVLTWAVGEGDALAQIFLEDILKANQKTLIPFVEGVLGHEPKRIDLATMFDVFEALAKKHECFRDL